MPFTVNTLVVSLNIKSELAPNAPSLLNCICLLAPAALVTYGVPFAYNRLLVNTLPAAIFAVTVKFPNVPTVVKLLVTTVAFKIVPLNVPAGATTTLVLAAVNCPC